MDGFFEFHPLGSGFHFGFDLREEFPALAVEEGAGLLHAGEVACPVDAADAGRAAIFDHMVEAVLVVLLARFGGPAGAETELAFDGFDRGSEGAGMGKRAEIPRAVVFFQACEGKAREGVGEVDANEQEAFVVAEADIVFRAEFLDEAALEEHGLRIAADDVVFEVPDAIDERAGFEVGRKFARRHEITPHAAAEVAGLTDINYMVQPVAHHIHAGLVGHVAKDFRKIGAWLRRTHLENGYSKTK